VVIYLNILAIDQARNGAWAVFDYEKGELIGYGTFEFSLEKYTYAKAIMHIKELIAAVLKTYDIGHTDARFSVFIQEAGTASGRPR